MAQLTLDVGGVLAGSAADLEHRQRGLRAEEAIEDVGDLADEEAARLRDLDRQSQRRPVLVPERLVGEVRDRHRMSMTSRSERAVDLVPDAADRVEGAARGGSPGDLGLIETRVVRRARSRSPRQARRRLRAGRARRRRRQPRERRRRRSRRPVGRSRAPPARRAACSRPGSRARRGPLRAVALRPRAARRRPGSAHARTPRAPRRAARDPA